MRVVAAVACREGRIMAARRGPHVRLAGKWEFPGGKVEPGEDDRAALARELQEELSIRVRVGACLGEHVFDGDQGPLCLVAYRVEIVAGEPALSDHDALVWLAPDELATLDWAEADLPFVEAMVSG